MRVYVAGPYTADTHEGLIENVNLAARAAVRLIEKGHSPLCPHLMFHLEATAREMGVPIDYEEWMRVCLDWLLQSEAILYLCPSPGADRELALAKILGLIVYRSVDEVPLG